MKIVFLGTPDFAAPSLESLINSKHEVVAVVTQPDKKKGRSGEIEFSHVKQIAIKNDIKVLQPEKIRYDGVEDLKALKPDIMVTCAYGQILSREILDIAKFGVINVHASLLPKYRGAAPIQWSVINGDKETGVTIMQTEEGLDTGNILHVKKIKIFEDETAGELFERLSYIGATALLETLEMFENGKVISVPQDHDNATCVKMLKKQDGEIDFQKNADMICNLVRGMNPWPTAYTLLNGKMFKIWKAKKAEKIDEEFECGEIVCADAKKGLIVACGNNTKIEFVEVQLDGGKRMSAKAFLLGNKNLEKVFFGKNK